jgi:hypothetical protein
MLGVDVVISGNPVMLITFIIATTTLFTLLMWVTQERKRLDREVRTDQRLIEHLQEQLVVLENQLSTINRVAGTAQKQTVEVPKKKATKSQVTKAVAELQKISEELGISRELGEDPDGE